MKMPLKPGFVSAVVPSAINGKLVSLEATFWASRLDAVASTISVPKMVKTHFLARWSSSLQH
jgi:hypothetical protein